ncbi:hypothetical protein SAMN04488134_11916 [Amphibacillus marinus]|uniref:Prepilin-type N-terminal cleavage/methylation domain-containing protein n=1 Tax=Amphibacillus marinus TaxID=872970 RepID=A0A1H8TS84_9BACI|nr:type II secretion system protein [Amphibacillus marinus]SEO93859.1 hypothetical protein SAMN04488134_11916 [Amphibacillus marinus]
MIREEQGITLVELLGVLAILSVVIVLIGSSHLFGQRQFVNQTDQIDKQAEVRQVMSQVTTDFRKITADEFTASDSYQLGEVNYQFTNQNVYRNGQLLGENISQFELIKLANEEGVVITIASTADKQKQLSQLSSSIYFRK